MSLKESKKKRRASIIHSELNTNTAPKEHEYSFEELITDIHLIKQSSLIEEAQHRNIIDIENVIDEFWCNFDNIVTLSNIERISKNLKCFPFVELIKELSKELTEYILNIRKDISAKIVFSLGSFTDKTCLTTKQMVIYSVKKAVEFFLISYLEDNDFRFFVKISLISIGREKVKLGISVSRDYLLISQKKSNSFLSLPSYLSYNKRSLSYFQETHLAIINKLNNMIGVKSFISESLEDNKYAINYVLELPNSDEMFDLNNNVLHNRGTILVAEDYIFNQQHLCRILTSLGYNTVIVGTGEEAVELSQLEKFDLIFMDMDMPVMNGYEAAVRIRKKDNFNRTTPIILQTSLNDIQDLKSLMKAFNDKISKPYIKDEIEIVVEKHLIKRQRFN